MLALGRAKARFQAKEGMSQRVALLTVDIANVGKTLGDKKYSRAIGKTLFSCAYLVGTLFELSSVGLDVPVQSRADRK